MTWATDQRQAWMKEHIDAGRLIKRAEVATRFNCTITTVAADWRRFEEKFPGHAVYDAHQKGYVRFDLAASGPINWRARAERAESQLPRLRRIEAAARGLRFEPPLSAYLVHGAGDELLAALGEEAGGKP